MARAVSSHRLEVVVGRDTGEVEIMCQCGERPNSDYEIIHTHDGRVLVIRLPKWLKQYRIARSRQLQCLDAINWLTRTLPPLDHHNVAVTMKAMEEFRRSRGGDRLPKINAFTGDMQAIEYKRHLTQHGLSYPIKTFNNTWKMSKEPSMFNTVPDVRVSGPELKLPTLAKGTNQMFQPSRGSLRVKLSYHAKIGVYFQQRKVSLSSLNFTKNNDQTKYRLEKK